MLLTLRLGLCLLLMLGLCAPHCQAQEKATARTAPAKATAQKARAPLKKAIKAKAVPAPANPGDSLLKRRARRQALHLRVQRELEALYWGSSINTTSEVGSRHGMGFVLPFAENWEFVALDRVSFFALKTGGRSAGRESLELRVARAVGNSFRPWFSVISYFNFNEARGARPSIAGGFSKSWRNGASIEAEGFGWHPWDEGYYTILGDGERHGGALGFTAPLGDRLALSARGHYEELTLGTWAKTGAQYAGNRYGVNARTYLRVLQGKNEFMGHGFRNEDLRDEYLTGSELDLYVGIDWRRYSKPDFFHAFNPAPMVFGQQLGMVFQKAFSPHLGISGEAYLGRDPDRKLRIGELAGASLRLNVPVSPRFRFWLAGNYAKTSANLESSGGAESIISVGLNYTF